jgi:hypothetical protein
MIPSYVFLFHKHVRISLYAIYYFALRSLLEKKDFRQRYNITILPLAGWQKREEREMETHTTRVSNTPWKLGVLETSQREFRQKTKKIVKDVPVTLKLAYETHVETWLRLFWPYLAQIFSFAKFN